MYDTKPSPLDSDDIAELKNQIDEFNPWAEILVGYIKRKGIRRQQELADRIPVEAATVSMWVRGNRLPKIGMVYRVSKALDLSRNQTSLFIDTWRETRDVSNLKELLEEAIKEGDNDIIGYVGGIISSY